MSGWSGFPMSKCPMCILSRTISNGLSIVDFFLRSCWTETESSRDQVFVPTEWQRIGQRERGEGEEENKSRATLVLSMVIPQKERRWTEVWSLSPCSCPPSLTPLRQVGSSAFFFTEGTGSPSPDHPPSRFIVEKPDFDGWTEARARGLDLRNFLKSDSGDAWAMCYVRIGDGIREGWKTFSVCYRGGVGWSFGKMEVRRCQKNVVGIFIVFRWLEDVCLMQRLLCNFYAKIFISRWTEMCRSSFLKFVFFFNIFRIFFRKFVYTYINNI